MILRPLYRIYRWSSGLRYWVMRRFTPAGLGLLAAVVVTMLMGFNIEESVTYQAFMLLLGMLAVAISFSAFFRMKFTVERCLPRFGTVGVPLRYFVAIRNLGTQTQSGLTVLENLADLRPSYADWRAVQLDDQKHIRPFSFVRRRANPFRPAITKAAAAPALPSKQDVSVSLELTPLRRGVLRFDGVTLARPDPAGLFRSFVKTNAPQSVLVLPKRYFLPPIAMPGAMKYQQGGVALASHIGQSDEFVALREYRYGDPMRHIHWRSWAKTGKPIVKEFEDEFFVRHALVLDTFTDRPHSEQFEEAVSVASSFACTILTQESLLDLLFVGSEAFCFTAGRGLAHADQMLEILASVRPSSGKPFASLETLVLNHSSTVNGVICVLLDWDEARQQLVRKLKSLGLPLLVFVIRNASEKKPLEHGPMRDAPEHLHSLEIGRIEEQLAKLV